MLPMATRKPTVKEHIMKVVVNYFYKGPKEKGEKLLAPHILYEFKT
jgi:hypothetical protein